MQGNEKNNEFTVKIDHTDAETGLTFKAELSGNMEAFKKAASSPAINALDGADLFEALIRQNDIRPVIASYHKDGELNDGANGEPALSKWHKNGKLHEESRFQNGELHDGINGETAHRYWDEDGTLAYWRRAGQDSIVDPAQLARIQAQEKKEDIFKHFGNKLKLAL